MSLPIERIIAEISNCDKPLRGSRLVELSNLNSEELEFLERAWAVIEPKRRWQIINRLVGLAKDNVELNFDSIFTICLKDQDAEVRSKAIEGLGESEETSLITPLINLLERDSSEKVQAVAATALGKFAMMAELKKLRPCHKSRIWQALLAMIDDGNKPVEVRRRALEAAAPLSLLRVKKAIMEAYQSHNSKLRTSAIYAMGRNCDHSWLPMLLNELDNADSEVRCEAATACGELGEGKAAPYLVALLNDSDVDVKVAAIQALGKIGGTEAKECLELCLNSPNEVIHKAAEQSLQELEVEEEPFSFRV